jgi:hypothetical protein
MNMPPLTAAPVDVVPAAAEVLVAPGAPDPAVTEVAPSVLPGPAFAPDAPVFAADRDAPSPEAPDVVCPGDIALVAGVVVDTVAPVFWPAELGCVSPQAARTAIHAHVIPVLDS